MPFYEYECHNGCLDLNKEPLKHTRRRPMSRCKENAICPECGQEAKRIMSLTNWFMGYKFLKDKSEKSPPAPTDSSYHPEWDQAYAP